jgi:uncharacterized protein YutE (UPF0331/DUF86 family)
MNAGHADLTIVRRHLLAIDASVKNLERHRGIPVERLDADLDERWTVERGLQLCAQNALDIATHLVASAGRDAPDYATAIDQLGALGAVPPDFARRFRGIAGFRNVLVHGYLALDVGRMHRLLNEQLDDFRVFAAHIERYLQPQ